jgi:hypothetical protein
MLKSEKKLAELNKILTNGKYNEINDRISILRSEEPFAGAVSLLADFYDKTKDEGLKLLISEFFYDMKERSCRAEVIDSIAAVTKPASKAMLASSCWQSGLDYSDHAVALAGIFSNSDYITSLECFTVLETCSGTISSADKSSIISRLEKLTDTYDAAKQKLARELIAVLRID